GGHSWWQIRGLGLDSGGLRSPWIEGYCNRQSARAGETVNLCVSTNPPNPFRVDLFRMGYYGGKGARLMQSWGPQKGRIQPDPPVRPAKLRECQWEADLQIKVKSDWPSGVYMARLSLIPESPSMGAWQSWAIFIVRDERQADILFQCSDNTWQAYNQWPNGYSLYTDPRGSLVAGV